MNKTLHFALRSQTIYATVAISLTSVVSAFTNLIIPILGDTTYIWAGPLTGLPFMFLISRAIIRHKLFNIRVVVARTLGYAFSFLVLAAGYFSISHFISSELRARFEGQSAEALLSLLLLIGTVLLFQPLKSRFDRLTNKIFYQDAYDPQEFLSELNKLLVETVDIESLLVGSSEIIKRNIKAEYCSFVIRETSYFEQRTIGAESKKFSAESTKIIRETMPSMHRKIVVTDELDEGNAELAEVLREHDIAVVVRLVTTLEYDVGGLGYMLLGVKKSGNPYTSQDMHVLEIIGNELVISAQNALRFEEIENFNITLQNKVDDATKRLRQTNEKLKKMDETKDEFISMASHQLRTPLTSVKGYISMVMEGDAGKINDQQHKLLDQAFISSQRMVFLIADLLNVSRLKTGKFVIEPKRINLADVIEGEVRQLQETAVSRKLELVYDKPENFPDLMLDDTKIRQVIMNFIDNAIYYTPFDGRIDVELKEKPQTIEFTVSDNGIGVPKSEQHKLFGKFYRAGNARKARPDGTGLGLFMAKKIIIAQGGTIIFKSTEGKGSVFGFTFPKDKLEVAGQIEVTDDGEDDS
ncbi:MAG: HAMP domain-containing sensor histidine kinase [Candidatus Saccharibacteria bacterium]|nr:HAMP domain-containing sensor histidine kinase [Candidatus Saccharibacteria bacterium]